MCDRIMKEVQNYVTQLFKESSNKFLVYHVLAHTQCVVNRAIEISGNYNLSERQLAVIPAAAWFHDTGYLFGGPYDHEKRSAEIMRDFMTKLSDDSGLINEIEYCILATKWPTHPQNLLEQIICDADTYHFGTELFFITNNQFMEEVKLNSVSFDLELFGQQTLNMLESHQYYTTYCKKLLTKGKETNIQKLNLSLGQKPFDSENTTLTLL